MAKRADVETRTVPVAALKAFAGVVFLLWLVLLAAFTLLDWPFAARRVSGSRTACCSRSA
ncbi:hypothetical protein LB823_13355 [Tsukamurella sp. M9C]|uniref:hypothetical protein n=1 Tax=Tsukamurella sp. M9C TaxID=2877520 RepID=UPI001CCDE3A9|nr:hypothetical protein [Tsukamurella sp. M9C]MCA0157183.1 hypothetical protein [Tsukamurella sp. M9C]